MKMGRKKRGGGGGFRGFGGGGRHFVIAEKRGENRETGHSSRVI